MVAWTPQHCTSIIGGAVYTHACMVSCGVCGVQLGASGHEVYLAVCGFFCVFFQIIIVDLGELSF